MCVLSARCPLSLCALFCVRGVARGLTALAFASTPSLRERPQCTARRTSGIHTLPTSVRAVPGSRATCSGLPGNKSCGSKVYQSLPRRPLGQRLVAVLRSTPMPVVAPITLSGCIPPMRVTLKSPSASRPHCTETSPIKDSDESVILPYGWKAHVSSSRTDGS